MQPQAQENAVAGGGDVAFSRDCEIILTNTVRFVLTPRLDAAGHNVIIKSLFNAIESSAANIVTARNSGTINTGAWHADEFPG